MAQHGRHRRVLSLGQRWKSSVIPIGADELSNRLLGAVAQIRSIAGAIAGVGFLVEPRILVTCAHVLKDAGYRPGGTSNVVFTHVNGAPSTEAEVLAEAWRDDKSEDVAFLRLHTPPRGVEPLALGSAIDGLGHRVWSFGFPKGGRVGGQYGFGIAGRMVPDNLREGPSLQLTQANDFTSGYSGGPVVDETTNLVIGMISSIARTDPHLRLNGITFATPTQVLRTIWPGLVETSTCPYRGLEPFTSKHAARFHGRTAARDAVMTALGEQQDALMLLGPSGSGKSSLVQAAVLPALEQGSVPGSDRWLPVFVPRPGPDLLRAVDEAGLPGTQENGITAAARQYLTSQDYHQRILLVIDQFEELFTRATTPTTPPWDSTDGDSAPKKAIEQLTQTIRSTASVTVVLIMRNDFYAQLTDQAPELKQALPALLDIPGTLTRHELHAIITAPLQGTSTRFENGLPARIVHDILASRDTYPALAPTKGSNQPPGREAVPATWLPALQLALLQLWDRRDDETITHDAYDRIGTVTGALATWCGKAFDQLPNTNHSAAKLILTSLVRPPNTTLNIPATRRLIPAKTLRELVGPTVTHSEFDTILSALRDQRIITSTAPPAHTGAARVPSGSPDPVSDPAVELIHDSLIRDWPKLRTWVAEDQEFHAWLDRTEGKLSVWDSHKNPGDLLQGTDLAAGVEWASRRGLPLGIAQFINISRRRARRRVQLLLGILVLALIATGLAMWQRQLALNSEGEARRAQKQSLSRQLATQSEALIDTNPDLASLLAVHSYKASQTKEATTALFAASDLPLRFRLRAEALEFRFTADGRTLATSDEGGTVRLWDLVTGHQHTTLTHLAGKTTDTEFSPDGRTFATAEPDSSVRLLDLSQQTVFTVHADDVSDLALSPDSRTLATVDRRGTLRLWDTENRRQRVIHTRHTGKVTDLVFSPNSRILATKDDRGTARLWDLPKGQQRVVLTDLDKGAALTFSPDGITLAAEGDDAALHLWEVATGRERVTLARDVSDITALAFSSDSRTLATAGLSDSVRLWDLDTGHQRLALPDHAGAPLSFSPDGRTLATGGSTLSLWDPATGNERTTLTESPEIGIDTINFSADGHRMATDGDDGTVLLWDLDLDNSRLVRKKEMTTVTAMTFSPNGRTLATGEHNGGIRLWNADDGHQRRALALCCHSVNEMAFSPDGHLLATVHEFGHVCLWDTTTGRQLMGLFTSHSDVDAVAFSPNGRIFATADRDGLVLLWGVTETNQQPFRQTYIPLVQDLAFSPDGGTLATGSYDMSVRLWDLDSGHQRTVLTGSSDDGGSIAAAFSPDGSSFASGDHAGTVQVWDLDTGLKRFLPAGHTDFLTSVEFSPDSRTLATVDLSATTVHLWDVSSGGQRPPLIGKVGAVTSLAFSPDSRILAVAGNGKILRLWDFRSPTPADAIRKVCQAVARDLTSTERNIYLGGASTSACPR